MGVKRWKAQNQNVIYGKQTDRLRAEEGMSVVFIDKEEEMVV